MNSLDVPATIIGATVVLQALPAVVSFALIGSASYLPADQVHDVDFAVMLDVNAMSFEQHLVDDLGWYRCGDYDSKNGEWCSVRKGHVNLMLTHSRKFFDGYLLATEVCKVLRLTDKNDRIMVCQVVRDGIPADQVRPPQRLMPPLPPVAA